MPTHNMTKRDLIPVPSTKGKTHIEILEMCRDMIAEYTPEAVALLVDTMRNKASPLPVKLRCAETLIERHMAKPIEDFKAELLGRHQILIIAPEPKQKIIEADISD